MVMKTKWLVGKAILCSLVACSVVASPATAQSPAGSKTAPAKSKKAPPAAKKVNEAFLPPDVQPNLPNVLLIGDSISIGYMLPARHALAGQANVWRPATNCGPTTRGLESLEDWLGDRKWDVIHFNFGLHDLKYMGKDGKNLADPTAEGSHQQVPIDQYAANLRRIAKRLKETGATVIWRETTPVPKGCQGRIPGDSARYNEAAAKVMAELGGIQTDSMYAFAIDHADLQLPANVHYSKEGSQMLAEHVAKSVRNALAARKQQ